MKSKSILTTLSITLLSIILFFGCQSNPADSEEHKKLMLEHEKMEMEHTKLADEHNKMEEMHKKMVAEHGQVGDSPADSLHTMLVRSSTQRNDEKTHRPNEKT